jgi:hypothetical protein
MQATATFTPSTVALYGESEVTIRVVNDTGAAFAGPLSTDALPALPAGLEYVGTPNIGDCGLVDEIQSGASCDMTATVLPYYPGILDWSGTGTRDGYTLTLTSASPLVVYIPAKEVRGTVSYLPASIATGGQATATILLKNTTGSTIQQPMSTNDLPALPNGLTLVGPPDLGSCAQAVPFHVQSTCQMTATVTSTTLGNHKWTGTGQTNSQANIYINLSDAGGLGVYGTPATVAVSAGDNQAIAVGDGLGALSVTVTDANGIAVPGVEVTFAAPSSGAGVTESSSAATTDAAGLAGVSLTANQTAGEYQVNATADSVGSTAVFHLSNLPGPPASVLVTSGSGQATKIGAAFANSLVAQVVDAFGNPVSGQSVTFTAPASGASGTFENGQKTATTGVDGNAASATFTANAVVGSYAVVASLQGASSANFSLENEDIAVTAAATSATVAANSADNPITLNLSGGVASAVAVFDSPSHGTATASGTTISYTPTAGYSGSDSFTYTASNGAGTSAPATVTVTVTPPPPTISSLSPAVGIATGGTTVTITGNNFNPVVGNNTVMFGARSATVTAASDTSLTVTTPSAVASQNTVDVSVTNVSTGGTATAADAYNYRKPPQITNQPSNATVNAGGNATFSVSAGGAYFQWYYNTGAGFLPLVNGGVYSGATTSTLTITGATLAMSGYTYQVFVSDSLGIGTNSIARTLTVNQAAPVANAVSATIPANSSNTPITLDITGGEASSVAVGTQPGHGTATASGTTITYTPTAGYSGTDSFTYSATNTTGTSAHATVTLTVTAPTLLVSPTSLPNGQVGTAYNQIITASGGTAPYNYAVTNGNLPAGLDLGTDGTLSGTPSAHGAFSITVTVTDSLGAIGTLADNVTIEREPNVLVFTPSGGALPDAMAGEDYSARVTATGGVAPITYAIASGVVPEGMVVNITTGELTGPPKSGTQGRYTFAIQATDGNGDTGIANYALAVTERQIAVSNKAVTVAPGATPTNVNLEAGATGGPFVAAHIVSVEPANAGTARIVMGEFAQAGGSTPVSFYLKFTPDPAYSGQVIVRFTLASSLGTSNPGIVTYNLGYDPVAVARQVQSVTQGFVQTRQNLLASTAKVPGLLERRMMAAAGEPVKGALSRSGDGLMLNFATSLAAGIIDAGDRPFNLWVDGTIMVHNRVANGNRWGSFGMISAGADYLLNEKILVGLSFHYDHMIDPTDADALLTGNGWLTGPYASIELGKGVFWDGRLLYGRSSNTIDTEFWDGSFGTSRWLLDTAITGQWQLDAVTTLTPSARAVYLNEAVQSYTVENGAGDAIVLDGFTSEQLRVSMGAEIARQLLMENGSILTPKLGVTGGVAGLDGSGAFGSIATSLNWQSPGALSIGTGLLFNIDSRGETSVGARVNISGQF